MSRKLPFMPFFVSDYLADTTHLTCEEHGAYLLLLFAMWKSGGSLPDDDVALSRIAHLSVTRWKKMRSNIVAFFRSSGAILTHKRVSTELRRSEEISNLRSEAGKRGADAKALKSHKPDEANASSLPQQNESKPQASHISQFTDTNSSSTASNQSPAPEPTAPEPRAADCVRIGQRITDLMGVTNDPRWVGNWSIVQVWIAQGFDENLDIWPVVSSIVERKKASGDAMPGTLKYFSKAIAEHHAARTSGPVRCGKGAVSTEYLTVKKGSSEFAAWIKFYQSQGRKTKFLEDTGLITVPSRFPPSEKAA